MRELCVLCHRLHEAENWKYSEYETVDGTRYGWFCEKWYKASHPEWIPERIKEDRKKFAKSTLQPYRNGVASQEFIDTYGSKNINPSDAKKAQNVWKDTLPTNWQRSK